MIRYIGAFLCCKTRKIAGKVKIFSFFFADIRKSRTFAPLFRTMKAFGRLAQLVQSICLTSRGSAVRIRQRPHRSPLFSGLFWYIYHTYFEFYGFVGYSLRGGACFSSRRECRLSAKGGASHCEGITCSLEPLEVLAYDAVYIGIYG